MKHTTAPVAQDICSFWQLEGECRLEGCTFSHPSDSAAISTPEEQEQAAEDALLLLSFGYDETDAQHALRASGGDLATAVASLQAAAPFHPALPSPAAASSLPSERFSTTSLVPITITPTPKLWTSHKCVSRVNEQRLAEALHRTELSPARRPDLNMTPELKTILDDIGVNDGLSHTSEYLVREFLLAINQRNLDDVGDNGIAEVTDDPALQARLLGDHRWVEGAAKHLGVSIGTFAQLQLEAWYGAAGKSALSLVYAALHLDASPLAAAIMEGRDADARASLAKHPKHAQLKHRGELPLHTLVKRLGETASTTTLDEETGEIFFADGCKGSSNGSDDSMALLEELVDAYPASLWVRTDTNWGLGYADGYLPLQLAAHDALDGLLAVCTPPSSTREAAGDAGEAAEAAGEATSRADSQQNMSSTTEGLVSAVLGLNVPLLTFLAARGEVSALDARGSRLKALHPDGWTFANAMQSLKEALQVAYAKEEEQQQHQSSCDGGNGLGVDELASCLEHLGTIIDSVVKSVRRSPQLPSPPPPPLPPHESYESNLPVHYGKGWSQAEFETLLNVDRHGELLGADFFDSFTEAFRDALLAVCAQIRMTDCLNSPARLAAEAATGDDGERILETILESLGGEAAKFQTEEDIVASAASARDLRATPDILFPSPGVLIPGVSDTTRIRWIDSKGGWLAPELSLPGKITSVKRQATKYEALFGPGLFVWHRGFFESVCDVTTTNVFHCSLLRTADANDSTSDGVVSDSAGSAGNAVQAVGKASKPSLHVDVDEVIVVNPASYVGNGGKGGNFETGASSRNDSRGGPQQPRDEQKVVDLPGRTTRSASTLQTSANAFVISTKKKTRVKKDTFKEITVRLNKLTLEKFDTLALQIKDLLVADLEKVQELVTGIFAKAIDEEFFSMMYAKLCKYLANAETIVGFRKTLLNCCQQEFEKATKADAAAARTVASKKEAAAAADKAAAEARVEPKVLSKEEAAEKREEELEAGYARNTIKRHMLGNIRFIGELFKEDLVSSKIMMHCINHLMPNKNAEEENVEILSKLLDTAGGKWETEMLKAKKNKATVKQTFATLKELANRTGLSSRIKFAVLDILDLRDRRWKPRTEAKGPKTIGEVHAEANLEHLIKIKQKSAHHNGGDGGRGSTGGGGLDCNSGMVTNCGAPRRPEKVDAGRFSGGGGVGGGGLRLGAPNLGGLRLGGIQRGADSSGGGKQSGRYSTQTGASNPFAGLARSENGTPAFLDRKINGCLENYLSIVDVDAVKDAIKGWGHPDATREFALAAIKKSAKTNEKNRNLLAKLFASTVGGEGGVPALTFVEAVKSLIPMLPDLLHDAPLAHEYVGANIAAAASAAPEVIKVLLEIKDSLKAADDDGGPDLPLKVALATFGAAKKASSEGKMLELYAVMGASIYSFSSDAEQVSDLCDRADVKALLFALAPPAGAAGADGSGDSNADTAAAVDGADGAVHEGDATVYRLLPAIAGTQTMYSSEVLIPSNMIGKLIGKEGSNVKRLCEQYEITIDIPTPEEITGDKCLIKINGFDESLVWRASDSIRGYTSASVRKLKGGKSRINNSNNNGGGGGGGGGRRKTKKALSPATKRLVPDVILQNRSLVRSTDAGTATATSE